MNPALQDEQALVTALKRRDPAALSALFEAYADKIYRLAAGMLRDEQQADGVVQDTFLALIEHIDRFEGRSNIGTWLYRVGYNECLMRLRRARPEVELDEEDEPDRMPASFTDWSTMPDALLDSAEAAAEMERAITSLKPELRAVFLLRDVEELSTAETARILNIGEPLVKVRLHRARLALREKLAAYFDERAQV